MSGFKDMAARDAKQVFCNPDEFGELRTLIYDGITYEDIPIVLSKAKEKDRQQLRDDHGEGIFRVNATLHCAAADLNGVQPEKGHKIKLDEGEDFFYTYYIVTSSVQMGMVILELEAMDE